MGRGWRWRWMRDVRRWVVVRGMRIRMGRWVMLLMTGGMVRVVCISVDGRRGRSVGLIGIKVKGRGKGKGG